MNHKLGKIFYKGKNCPESSPKIVSVSFTVLLLVFLLGFYIFAWQEPTSSPPAGNVPAPLNTGDQDQAKQGRLDIGGGLSYWIGKLGDSFALSNNAEKTNFLIGQDGNVGIGTESPTQKLEILGNLKLNSNQAMQVRLENSSSHPTACEDSKIGYIYYNTAMDAECICTSEGWVCRELIKKMP